MTNNNYLLNTTMEKTTFKRTAIVCALSLFAITGLFAQDEHSGHVHNDNHSNDSSGTAKRILITAPTTGQLQTIQAAGLDLHCGAKFEGDNLRLDLQFPEIQVLDELGLSYVVVEDNLTQFYVDRSAKR